MPLRRSERIANLAKKQDNSNVTENKLPYNVANHYSEAREKAIEMLLTSESVGCFNDFPSANSIFLIDLTIYFNSSGSIDAL